MLMMRYARSLTTRRETLAESEQDATLSVDLLCSLGNCTGRIASTGMCLGGHLVSLRRPDIGIQAELPPNRL